MAARTASAIGKSKWLPSFRRSAGARLIRTRLGGRERPMAVRAARTRSRAFANGLVRQADNEEGRETGGDLHLNLDRHGLDAAEGEAADAGDHVWESSGAGWGGKVRGAQQPGPTPARASLGSHGYDVRSNFLTHILLTRISVRRCLPLLEATGHRTARIRF